MSEWHKTACNLCYVNCALEVQTDGRAITRIRGAMIDHLRSGSCIDCLLQPEIHGDGEVSIDV